MPNNYDDAVGSVLGKTAGTIRNNVSLAANSNPAAEAQYQHLAALTNTPVETVRNMPDVAKQQAAMQSVDADGIATNFPHLANFLSDADKARLVHDSIPQMAAVEKTLQHPAAAPVADTGFNWKDELANIPSEAIKGLGGAYNKAASGVNTVLGAFPVMYDKATGGSAESDWWFKNMVAPRDEAQAVFKADPRAGLPGKLANATGNLVGMLSQITLSGTGAAAGAESTAASTVPGAIAQTVEHGTKSMLFPALNDAVDTGKKVYAQTGDANAAMKAAQAQYLSTSAMGVIPMSAPGRLAARLAGGAASGLATGEASRNFMNAEMPDSMQQSFNTDDAIISSLTGSILAAHAAHGNANPGGLRDVLTKHYADIAAAEKAQDDHTILSALSQQAAANPLRERSPDQFHQFVEDASENGHITAVYIDAHTLNNVFHQSGADALDIMAKMPDIAGQMHEGIETSGTIKIPTADYATYIAGTPLDAAILPHLKTDPAGKTKAEADQFNANQIEELRAHAQDIVNKHVEQTENEADSKAVYDKILGQLDATKRFTPDVNKIYATIAHAHYITRAEQMGMKPSELLERYPLNAVAERMGGAAFNQGDMEPRESISQKDLAQLDKDYAEALKNGDDATASKIVSKVASARGYVQDVSGTRMDHTAPTNDGYSSPLHDLSSIYPDDIYSHNATRYYGDGTHYDRDSIATMQRVKGKPDADVKLYRAVPKGVKDTKLRVGDWVSISKGYAEEHGKANINGPYRIITDTVKAKHVFTDANSIHEQGFDDGKNYAYKDTKNNRKLFDTVVTDPETGEVVPPSKRFNSRSYNEYYQSGAKNRGAYNPETGTIALLKDADLTTYLHELGHHFLEINMDMAGRSDASELAKKDTDILIKWFGVDSIEAWHNLDFEEKRSYHEQFARGFEAYLMEGKAPNVELQGIFSRFKSWFLNVYKSLTALNVELTPEVRSVMDRMLASEESIKSAEQVRGYEPLFKSADDAGMTPEQWADYQHTASEATDTAVEEMQGKSMRDMKWLSGAKSKVLKALQEEAASARKEINNQVSDEVDNKPIYQAMHWLKRGEMTGHDGELIKADKWFKLDIDALKEMYPETMLSRPNIDALGKGKYGMAGKDGLNPDLVAEMFGFSSGDELVRTLLETPPRKEVIEGMTDQRMLEEHGELSTSQGIERAAEAAIHNEARARFMATGLKILTKSPVPVRHITQAAKEAAESAIANKKIRDLNVRMYSIAEARANRNAIKAAPKDTRAAAVEQRAALLNNQLVRAATDAVEDVRKGKNFLEKYNKDSVYKSLDADYVDQIHALLERFYLRSGQSLKAIDKRATLAAWMKSQQEMGLEPDIPPALENEALRKSYKDMTVSEFRGLVDTIKQIDHLGRLKRKLLTAKDQRSYEAARDEIVSSIHEHAGNRTADTRTPTTNIGRTIQGLRQFWAAHLKPIMLARTMDGGKDGGPMWEYFVRNANDKGNMETTMRSDATRQLSEILSPIFKLGMMGGKGKYFKSIDRSLNRESRLAIALNMGNDGNIQRLLGGENWTRAQIEPVLHSLTAEEWHAVQAIWDHFESYRPQIAAKDRRVYGKEPDWVEPTPFTAHTADGKAIEMRGGYYPIKYDPAASQRAEDHADAEGAKRQLQGAYTSATTRRSFTKSRVDEVTGRPLLYSMSGLYSGVNDVIHDLSWHEWLIDANRLLRSKSIDGAIREHYGPEVKTQFKDWVKDIAEGERGANGAGEAMLGKLRQGVSAAGLGFNLVSALMQPIGITQSITRLGAGWVGKGLTRYITHPFDAMRDANSKSEFMANRSRTRFRELNELRNKVQDESPAMAAVHGSAYFLMMRMQQMVDVPTWWGGYEKAIAEGNDEPRAVALADQAVIDSQGSGMTKDLSAIERGGPFQKLFTTFYSFMNTQLNLGVTSAMTRSKGQMAIDFLMLSVVPTVMVHALKSVLMPGGGDEWDLEKLSKRLLAEEIDNLMGLMMVVREFSEAAKTISGANDLGRDYTGPAGLRMISDVGKLAQQAHQGEFDTGFRKAAINVTGDMFGLPSAQLNRTITGVQALQDGKTNNPMAIGFGYQEQH
jgi:hypothetical protein